MESVNHNVNNNKEDLGKLILRLSTGSLMLFHGVHKIIFGHDFIRHLLETHGLPTWLVYGVPIGEIICPLLIITGIWTRQGAYVVALTMAMSIFLFYGQSAFLLDEHGGLNSQLNLLFLFCCIAIGLVGPGKYHMQSIIRKNSNQKVSSIHTV